MQAGQIVADGVEDADELVEAGPVAGAAGQTLLEGVPGQTDVAELYGHLADAVPDADVAGVDLDEMETAKSRVGQGKSLFVINILSNGEYLMAEKL